MIINIRGANGAGKSTVARSFISDHPAMVDLAHYTTPKGALRHVEGYIHPEREVCVVGSYRTACGGMDTIKTFDLAFQAIRKAADLVPHVVCEGVLASTVYGSWASFARDLDNNRKLFAFAYLRVPVEECLRRIYERNGGKKIDEELVRGKVRAVEGTRTKALKDGLLVYDLPLGRGEAEVAVWDILNGRGMQYAAKL